MPLRRLFGLWVIALLMSLTAVTPSMAEERRKIIIDQDAFEGPGLQPVLMLLQDPSVEVLGITITSGDAWAPEETAATLRMLELIGRTDVPVVQGAIFPLVNSKERNRRREAMYGQRPYKGAWMEKWPSYNTMERRAPHDPMVVPDLPEGLPAIEAHPGSAAEFMLEMTRRYPGEVSIIAMGPVTNLALAQRLDETFAGRVKEVFVEGGSFLTPDIDGEHDEFALQEVYNPRSTFNFWWDPEAAHILFTTRWNRLVLVAGDAHEGIAGSQALLDRIHAADTPVSRYVARIAQPGFPLWDEVEAATFLDPSIVEREFRMAMNVDLMPGSNYGALLVWPEGGGPGLGEQDVEVVLRVDKPATEAMFVKLLGR